MTDKPTVHKTVNNFDELSADEVLALVEDVDVLDVDDDIKDVLDYLNEVAGHWETISQNLHVRESKITELRNSRQTAPVCLGQAITDWLKLNYNYQRFGKPTWKKVAESVVKLDSRLFRCIALEHTTNGVMIVQDTDQGKQTVKAGEKMSAAVPNVEESNSGSHLIMPTFDLHQPAGIDQSLVLSSPRPTGKSSPAEQVEWFESRFHDLRRSALTQAKDRGVTVEDFRQTLMTLPHAISKEHEQFLLTKYPLFEKATSIESIFLHLNFYLSFIDFSLLEHIVKHFGSPSLKQNMKSYSKDMEMFRTETPVADVIPYLSGRPEPPPHFAKLKMTLNFDPKTCTLEDLEQHRKKFGSEFSLSKFALFLMELGEGSLVEICLIPSDIIPSLKYLDQQKSPSFFHELNVLDLFVNEECLYPPLQLLPPVWMILESPSWVTDVDPMSAETLEEDVPVITPSRQKILDTINSEIATTPESCGLAIVVICTEPLGGSEPVNNLIMFNRTLASTFRKLKFAVFEHEHGVLSQTELSDVMYIAGSNLVNYPKSSDYCIAVIVASVVGDSVNALSVNFGKVNISRDLIEPFLPRSAPALADIPKIFLINTINFPTWSGPIGTSSLSVPSEGNFLLSYTNSSLSDEENMEYLSDRLCDELRLSCRSIEDALTEVKGQLPPRIFSMTVISHLDKSVYLHPDGTLDPIHAGKPMEDVPGNSPSKQRRANEIAFELKSTPDSCGLVIKLDAGPFSIHDLAFTHALSFKKSLRFAVYEKEGTYLRDIIYAATHLVEYPKLSAYCIVVIVEDCIGMDDINTLFTSHANISGDIIEPFLPPSAPALADIPKIFLLNTYSLGNSPIDMSSLSIPSEGNFIVSYAVSSNYEGQDCVNYRLRHELTVSRHSIEDVLTKVKGRLPPESSMTVISHLDKPVYLHPGGPTDPTHTGEITTAPVKDPSTMISSSGEQSQQSLSGSPDDS